MTFPSFLRSHPTKNIIVSLIGLSILIYSPLLLVVIISIVLTYKLLDRKFSQDYIDSRFLVIVISLFTYMSIVCLVVLISSALVETSLGVVLVISGLLIAALFIYDISIVRVNYTVRRRWFSASDGFALGVTCVALFFLGIFPLIKTGALQHHSNILITITGNVDNGTHLAIFNDYINFQTNRIWDTSHISRSSAGGFYPSSWHGANAAIVSTLSPSIKAGVDTIVAYSLVYLFWIGVLIFLSSKLCLAFFQRLRGPKRPHVASLISIGVSLLLAVYLFSVHLLELGFFTFIPQLIVMLLFIYCFQQIMKQGVSSKGILGLTALYAAASLAAWVLLLPAALLAIAVTLLFSVKLIRKQLVFRELISSWPLCFIALMSIISQLWLMHRITAKSTVGLVEGLSLNGWVPIYDPLIYLVLIGGLIGAVLLSKKHGEIYKPTLVVAISTLVTSAFIFFVQLYTTGSNHYYYYKSLLILPVILVPIGVAVLAFVINKVSRSDRGVALTLVFFIPLSILLLIPSDPSIPRYLSGARDVSPIVNQYIIQVTRKTDYPTKNVSVILSGTIKSSDISTLLLQANRPYSDCFEDIFSNAMNSDLSIFIKHLATYNLPAACSGYNVSFVVGTEYKHLLQSNTTHNFTIDILR